MSTENWLDKFVGKNAWAILMMIISIVFWGTSVMGKVQAVDTRMSKMENIIERVVALEEHDKDYAADIKEIKQDIKTILSNTK